jgi:hypothetical protein
MQTAIDQLKAGAVNEPDPVCTDVLPAGNNVGGIPT